MLEFAPSKASDIGAQHAMEIATALQLKQAKQVKQVQTRSAGAGSCLHKWQFRRFSIEIQDFFDKVDIKN